MGESRLLMICPSRGRPANVARLLRAWDETRAEADLVIAVDTDDPELGHYEDVFWADHDPSFERKMALRIAPRERLGPTLNAVARATTEQYDFVGFLGDDHVPRTSHWDAMMLAALDQLKMGMVYGNDLLQGPMLPTAVAMTSDIIKTLGWMVPPGLVHLYIDNAWLDLGRAVGRIQYLPDVIIEHVHPVAGKAPMDARYAEVNSAEQTSSDHEAYLRWQRESFPTDAERLRRLLEVT